MPRNMAQFERTNEAGVRRIEKNGGGNGENEKN
jgi:hypothetical protein